MAKQVNNQRGSKNYIEKVTIVGAGGHCGKFITEALLKTGKHVVSAITRADSKSKLPDGVQVKVVDYANQSSIVEALRDQDVLIITLAVTAQDQEIKLIEAAAAANVPWVFPNEWAPDMANETLSAETLVGEAKKKTREHIEKVGKSSWIAVVCGFWYEWSLAISGAYGFDFENRTVTLFDDGETPISNSTWPQVGRAVASLLSLKIHPDGEGDSSPCLDRFRNKHVYVSSFTVSQKDMLQSVLRVTQTKLDDWKLIKEPVRDRYTAALELVKKGDYAAFVRVLYSRVFFPDDSGNYEKIRGLSNDVLGLPKEDIDEFTKIAIERSKINPFAPPTAHS